MEDIASQGSIRVSWPGVVGWALVLAGLVALWRDALVLSGWTIAGLAAVATGTLLVARVLRRQAVRRAR